MLVRVPRRPPSIRFVFKSSQPYTTVFSREKYREIDHKAFEEMKTVLRYILRPGTSGEYGFGNRNDGYVSVKQLVSFFLSMMHICSLLAFSLTTLNFNRWI